MIYLDWAASAPPEPEALEAAKEASLRFFANPSAAHAAGREAHELLEQARTRLRLLLPGGEIAFTSGATESNELVLLSLVSRLKGSQARQRPVRIIVGAAEHASVFEQARMLEQLGIDVAFVAPNRNGFVEAERVAELVDNHTVLVSVQAVNNETGAVQPVGEISRAVREQATRFGRRIIMHADAAQAFGKIPFLPAELGLDAVSVSGHKIGGPRGVGALWISAGLALESLAAGGGQESGRRPGTENLGGILGFVTAAEKRAARLAEEYASAGEKVRFLTHAVMDIPGVVFFPPSRRESVQEGFSPYIVSFGFPPLPGEVLLRLAESKGFMIGTGSACASRKKTRTRVLESMGVKPEIALSAVRISIGHSTTKADLEALAGMLKAEVPSLLAMTAGSRS